VVLATGDPLFFGIGRYLLEHLPADDLVFHPHAGSVAVAFARIKVPWDDARVVSLHGRPLDELDAALAEGPDKLAVLTDGKNTPGVIARRVRSVAGGYDFWVCEDLDGREERVERFTPESLEDRDFAPLNIVVLVRRGTWEAGQSPPLIGIDDGRFARRRDQPGMITKAEVRVLTLARLELPEKPTLWDIGAGAGSVGIEAARLRRRGSVYLVERRDEDIENIRANAARFEVPRAFAVHGEAPAALAVLPPPDRVFIGGSGGRLAEILAVLRDRLIPGGVCVVNACTDATRQTAVAAFREFGWACDVLEVNLSVLEPNADPPRSAALTPVSIIRGRKP
jgi:precorrin-6Y C5,15-methyltransferase (decarboxylating)